MYMQMLCPEYSVLRRAFRLSTWSSYLLQAVCHRQAAAVEILLNNGASVEARDEVLGSALDALHKVRAVDTNSDDEGDTDEDEDEDEDFKSQGENEV